MVKYCVETVSTLGACQRRYTSSHYCTHHGGIVAEIWVVERFFTCVEAWSTWYAYGVATASAT
jgi:hypothetical protein